MALSSTEIDRIRYELGYPVTRIGAEPYITYAAVFDRAIVPYLTDVGSTSTSTVAAAASGAITTVTVASNPTLPQQPGGLAFVVNAKVAVDVGPAAETAIILAVSGLQLSLNLTNAHGPTQYPVVLAGAEQVVRDIITRLDAIQSELTSIAPKTAGMAQVDEVKIHASERGRTTTRNKFDDLLVQRNVARADLADALGLENMRMRRRSSTGASIAMY